MSESKSESYFESIYQRLCLNCLETTPSMITSTYSATFSSSSSVFTRPYVNTNDSYYYQAIQVTVSMTGTYIFMSNSSLDTYGYFYSNSFDPLSPSVNLIASDDDSNGARQFRINLTLQFQSRYTLVVTTHGPNGIGYFLVKAIGPASLELISINQFTHKSE